jgi:hypothetical protein
MILDSNITRKASASRTSWPAAAQGLDTLDMAAVTTLYEQWAGVEVRTSPPRR